jgi:uncharacterized protein (TIGR03437 family)
MAAALMSAAHAAVTLSVTARANPAVYAASLTYTVAVAPLLAGDPVPTGAVSAILDGSHVLANAALDSAGRALIAIPPLDAGSNAVTFSYSGDGRYAQAQSNFTQFLSKAHSHTAAALNGRQAAATVRIDEPSANSGSAPSGTVQFFDGTTLLGTATLAPSSLLTSVAELKASTAPASLTAVYSGDANFNSSRSATAVQTGAGAVTLSVISSANPSVFAEPVTLMIAVAPVAVGGPIPTGSVAASLLGLFSLGTVTLDASGQGSLAAPTSSAAGIPWGFPAGSNNVLLTYSGDANYANTQTNFTQLVNKADTIIVTGPDGRATVSTNSPTKTPIGFALPGGDPGSANPTGSVQFLQDGALIGTAPLSPTGHLQSTAHWSAGASPGVAMYSGDANHNGSTSAAVTRQSQTAATTTVTSSANPASFAEPVTFSATVAPSVAGGAIPTGTVLATVFGSETLGSAFLDATGKASFTVPQTLVFSTGANYDGYLPLPWGLATGSNVITVTYSGDSNYAQGQTTFNQMVNKVDTVTSVAVAPAAAPAKSFTIAATVAFHELAITLTPFAIPSTGNVSPSPTGSLNFYDGTTLIGTATLLQGINFTSTATLATATVPTSVSAVYSGDVNFNGSSSASTRLSGGAPVTISLGASTASMTYGEAFPVVATVTPAIEGALTPTGTLTFFDGSQNLGWTATLDAAGVGTLPIPEPLPAPAACAPNCPAAAPMLVLSPGSHSITAAYSGDSNYAAAASSPLSLQIAKAASTIALAGVCAVALPGQCYVSASVADAQPPAGGPVHFMTMGASGLVDGDPSGMVQFFSGSMSIGTASLTSSAALSVTSTATLSSTGGSSSAVYSGDPNFQGSTSPAFSPFATAVSLAASPNPSTVGQSVMLTANVAGQTPAIVGPTGSVTFLDGATLLGQVTLSGTAATLSTTFTTAGPHFLSATFSGDSFYLPSTSAGYGQIVTPPGGALGVLNLTPGSPSAAYGQQVTFFVTTTGSPMAPPYGAVALLDGAVVVVSGMLIRGYAELIVTLPVGTHQLSAVWVGDGDLPPAVSPVLTYVVTRAPTIITLGGQPLTATVSASPAGAGTPTGTVQFTAQGLLATSTLIAGSATVTIPASTSGPIVAVYSGDANFAPSTTAPPSLAMVVVSGVVSSVVAPDEIATIYGANLAASTTSGTPPLSTSLAGVSVTVADINGVSRFAPLYYASAGQINFVVPTGTASGPATLTVAGQSLAISVTPISPNLFPVGQIVAVHPDGTQSIYDTDAPIVFGTDSLYLVVYATGIRHVSSLFDVTCTVGNNLNLPVTYAGAQSQYPGLDQVVVPLPPSLQGAGTVKVLVTAGGYASNAISLTFQ